MRDPNDIIAEAGYECVKALAQEEYHVSLQRMYKILSEEHHYPQLCRLATAIGRHNPIGLREIQADFNARCERALRSADTLTTTAQLHKEAAEAIQALMEGRPLTEQEKELRELIAVATARLAEIEA